MKKFLIASLAAMAISGTAQAAVTYAIGSTTVNSAETFPAAYGFTPSLELGFGNAGQNATYVSSLSAIVSGSSSGNYAAPAGGSGAYLSTGPSTTSPVTLDFSSLGGTYYNFSLLWGSVDDYNTISFLDGSNNVLASFNGSLFGNPAVGNQGVSTRVTFNFSGTDANNFKKVQFSSSQNAFEVDNVALGVPEPQTWMMMIFGFGAVGYALRRNRKVLASA